MGSCLLLGFSMPSSVHLYIDESGSRRPDRKAHEQMPKHDYFAMGGLLINEEDEEGAKAAHAAFCKRWDIEHPLHSVEIRHACDNFKWLYDLATARKQEFYADLHAMICSLPILGVACVIDRPGYNVRYAKLHEGNRWKLCKTAFAIALERSARFAIGRDRKLKVFAEACGPKEDRSLKAYYADLKAVGMPFNASSSSKYGPLDVGELNDTLYDLRFKDKRSELMQIADLLLFPMAVGGYDREYIAYRFLMRDGMLIDCHLSGEELPTRGIKYSCFDSSAIDDQTIAAIDQTTSTAAGNLGDQTTGVAISY